MSLWPPEAVSCTAVSAMEIWNYCDRSRKGGRGGCRSGKWWLINAYGECMHTYMLMRSQNRQWRQYLRLLRPPAEEAAPLLQEEVACRCVVSSDSPFFGAQIMK